MVKIEGTYFKHKEKDNLDLTDVNYIRFNIDELNYMDITFKNGELCINGSSSIKIMPRASNSISVSVMEVQEL